MFAMSIKVRKSQLPIDIQCELFDHLVVPMLLYGNKVWGYQNLSQIEKFHKRFLKHPLKVNRGTANCMVYGEVGRFKVDSLVDRRMINFWLCIVHGKESKIQC